MFNSMTKLTLSTKGRFARLPDPDATPPNMFSSNDNEGTANHRQIEAKYGRMLNDQTNHVRLLIELT